MSKYTYTIYDSPPNESDGNPWPSHSGLDLEADDDDEAFELVRDELEVQSAGLSTSDGYEVGQRLHTLIEGEDGCYIDSPTHVLTEEDLE